MGFNTSNTEVSMDVIRSEAKRLGMHRLWISRVISCWRHVEGQNGHQPITDLRLEVEGRTLTGEGVLTRVSMTNGDHVHTFTLDRKTTDWSHTSEVTR